jgi:tetratricopeptide (TPR) repeat protein
MPETETTPNVQLIAWREAQGTSGWSRAEMAAALNATPTGLRHRLACDEERIRRWERGEVLWPHPPYRGALKDLTGRPAESLGFLSPGRQREHRLVAARTFPADALRAEAELFDTMELARMADVSDIGPGTVEAVQEAVELLCRAYPATSASTLRDRSKQRLKYVLGLLAGRLTLSQHREILVQAGWLAALLGCLHYDLGEREHAEAARLGAFQMGKQAEHSELMAWAYEMSAWFALTEGRYEDVVDSAQRGQAIAGTGSAMVQLTLQEAKGHARLRHRRDASEALTRGAEALSKLPMPSRPDHHFVFDHTKWIFYAATIYTWQGDDDRAEEHAREILTRHSRPDGSTNAPMRTANARIDLGMVHARRGDLDAAVEEGLAAFRYDRKSLTDLINRGKDLDRLLQARYPGEKPAISFHERLMTARRALAENRPELLGG